MERGMPVSPIGLSEEKAARMMKALREGRTLRKFFVKAWRLEAYFKAHPIMSERLGR
jgi:hypothetical protein